MISMQEQKNRWAMMLYENEQVVEAGKAYGELSKYWQENAHGENMYAARFCYGYGEFLEKTQSNENDLFKARTQYNTAYKILRESDGENAQFTKDALAKSAAITERSSESHARNTHILFASNNQTPASSQEESAVLENDAAKCSFSTS